MFFPSSEIEPSNESTHMMIIMMMGFFCFAFPKHWPKHLHFHVPQSCWLAPLRLALLIIAVEMMAGCWLVEQPGNSILRFHPRVMDVFFHLRVAWLSTNEISTSVSIPLVFYKASQTQLFLFAMTGNQ